MNIYIALKAKNEYLTELQMKTKSCKTFLSSLVIIGNQMRVEFNLSVAIIHITQRSFGF